MTGQMQLFATPRAHAPTRHYEYDPSRPFQTWIDAMCEDPVVRAAWLDTPRRIAEMRRLPSRVWYTEPKRPGEPGSFHKLEDCAGPDAILVDPTEYDGRPCGGCSRHESWYEVVA